MHAEMIKVRREQLRWRILETLDTVRPDRMAESLMLGVLVAAGFDLGAKDLARELDYLQDRKLLRGDSRQRWALTYVGVDVIEYTLPCLPGIARPDHAPDRVAKTRREQLRLRILAVLDTSRPVSMPESFLADVLTGAGYAVTPTDLRRELDYLQDRGLVQTDRSADWLCEVTHYGTDLVEGTSETYPGIARSH